MQKLHYPEIKRFVRRRVIDDVEDVELTQLQVFFPQLYLKSKVASTTQTVTVFICSKRSRLLTDPPKGHWGKKMVSHNYEIKKKSYWPATFQNNVISFHNNLCACKMYPHMHICSNIFSKTR